MRRRPRSEEGGDTEYPQKGTAATGNDARLSGPRGRNPHAPSPLTPSHPPLAGYPEHTSHRRAEKKRKETERPTRVTSSSGRGAAATGQPAAAQQVDGTWQAATACYP